MNRPAPESDSIADAIARRQLPIKDGLYLADGHAIALALYWEPKLALETGARFDARRLLREDPTWVCDLDLHQEIRLPAQMGFCLIGGGSYGADGCAVCLAADRSFKWALLLQESNPFDALIPCAGTEILLCSTAGLAIAIDIDSPQHLMASRRP